MSSSRREFLAGMGAAGVLASMPRAARASSTCPFRLAVINDEISPDFDHACYVASHDFGLQWIELRSMWTKNITALDSSEIEKSRQILAKYNLRVTDIGSPLYKVNWPDAPPSPYGSKEDLHGANETTFNQQQQVLERSISLAKQFKTNKVRCFDFWRIDNVGPYRKAINAKLQEAAEFAAKQDVMLVLENEFECNTATGREAAATLAGVPSQNLALNWDPGNAVMRGELDAYPGGWDALPKERIHHCHVKNAVKDATGKIVWSPVDIGYVDWTAQFKALKGIGYANAVNFETHWKGAGTPEASSIRSWEGMKKDLEQAGAI